MTAPLRRRLRLLRRGAWYALARVLVALALGNGVASQLLPLAERHPDRIAQWLGARAGAPVAFDGVQTEWTRRGPLLRLDNLRVGEGDNPVRIGDAEVLVAQYVGWLPGRSLTELRVRGLDLTLQRDPHGRWSVLGLPGQQQGGDPFAMLERLGELQVSHARLHVSAPELGLSLRLPRIDLRLQVDGQRIRGGADAWLRESATPFEMALDLQRGSGDGRVYAGSRQADLAEVAGAFRVAGISPAAGKGRARVWLRLQGRQVVAMHADADLKDVRLRGAPLSGQGTPALSLQAVELAATWARRADGWQLRVPRLRLGDGEQAHVMDGLAADGGARLRVQAPRLDAGPLLQLLALGDVAAPGLRGWLRASAPAGTLHDVQLHGQRGGALQASARAEALRFDPVRNTPGMRGISGWLQGDAAGLRLRFDPQALAAFDWPAGFGVVHEFRLDGEAVLWRDGEGWSVHTPGLALDGERLHVRTRGGIGFQGDGTRPRLDLAAEIGDVPVTMASGFWVHHLMPKSTVQWLDAALRGGTLEQVRAGGVGDLDDWPFRNEPGKAGAGLFRADARMRGGTLKFQPDWPAIEDMNAELRFVADGFSVDGSGRIGGVPIEQVRGGIARYGRAELELDAATAGTDARHLLSLLRNSPLHKERAEILDNLRAAGPAAPTCTCCCPSTARRRRRGGCAATWRWTARNCRKRGGTSPSTRCAGRPATTRPASSPIRCRCATRAGRRNWRCAPARRMRATPRTPSRPNCARRPTSTACWTRRRRWPGSSRTCAACRHGRWKWPPRALPAMRRRRRGCACVPASSVPPSTCPSRCASRRRKRCRPWSTSSCRSSAAKWR